MNNNKIRLIKDLFWIVALSGLVAAALRLMFGLGATTNLSDGVPWGFWKVFNMIAGVALSTSGFTVGFLVYVLKLKQFKPFMKPAILIAFLGYGCSCVALLFDIGLPLRFWHPIFMWNINSFLFEVFWCVMLYFTVTAIELAPLIFEKLKAEKIAKFLHGIAFVVVIIGISLSSLHHSSLGSLFLVSPQRLHLLWYSPRLPLLFIFSAMGGGIMFLVFVRIVWAWLYNPEPVFGKVSDDKSDMIQDSRGAVCAITALRQPGSEMTAVSRLAMIGSGILLVYFVLKIADLFLLGSWPTLLTDKPENILYITELGLGVLVPLILIASKLRRRPVAVGIAGALAAFGLVFNRLNVGIFGYFRDAQEVYWPSLSEWALGLGAIAAAGLVLMAASENMPIFDDRPARTPFSKVWSRRPGTLRQAWNIVLSDSLHRVTLIAVFIIPAAFILMYPPYSHPEKSVIEPSMGLDLQRRVLKINGDRQAFATTFNHADHQKRLGDSTSCVKCHHVSLPGDRSTPCFRCHRHMHDSTMIFNHEDHQRFVAKKEALPGWHAENQSCTICHTPGVPRTRTSSKDCLECHQDDMYLAGRPAAEEELMYAVSYCQAMHENCLACHKREAAQPEFADIDQCATCHETLRKESGTATFAAGATTAEKVE